MKRRKAIGKAISTRKEDYDWKDGFAELIEKKSTKNDDNEKKIDVMKGTNKVVVFPDENSGIKEEVEDQKQDQGQQDQRANDAKTKQRKQQTIANQKKILMAKLQQLQKGIPLSQEEIEIEGEQIDEKITAKTEMGTAIKDFYASKSPQLAGRTKEERRKAAIAAVLTARRGGKKLGEEVKKQEDEEDTRAIPTKMSLVKNRLRAKGIQVSGDIPSPRNTETAELPPIGEEVINERRKEDKVFGTPRKPRNKAFELVAKSMGTGRMGVQPRGVKKEKGAATPGPSITPAQKVAKRRATAQRAQASIS